MLRQLRITTDDAGQRCISFVDIDLGRPVTEIDRAGVTGLVLSWMTVGVPICPGADAPAVPVVEAQRIVRTIDFPAPVPRIEPGRMLVGLTAYLEAGPELEFAHGETTPLGPITITATARTTVDWGDGTVTEHESAGGPWPEGDITHVYRHPGTYQVLVTYAWVAHWEVAGEAGTIGTGLATTGTIDDFTVEERQAVISTNS